MRENIYLEPLDPGARKGIEEWLDCEDNEQIRTKLAEKVKEGLKVRGGVGDRQEAMFYLEHLLRDSGYPESVSVSLEPPAEENPISTIHLQTISPLDGDTLNIKLFY